MTYYLEPDFWNFATKKELDDATGFDASDLAAKKKFLCFKR